MNKENLVQKEGRIVSPHFSSYADRVCIEAAGISGGSNPRAELFCNLADGQSRLYAAYTAEADGSCSFFFDPINLQIYENAVSFRIELCDFASVSYFTMQEQSDSAQGVSNAASAVFTDDAGNKWVSVLQADRATEVTVSTTPCNVLFVGNSILLGMSGGYGMCASSSQHDYCHHVQQAILARNPECRFSKLHGSAFEHSVSREDFEAWWSTDLNCYTGRPAMDSFRSDLDLIILQLGDNVGTQKLANFLDCTPILLQRIKTLCPRARILWVYGWFNRPLIAPPIARFCEEWKLEPVDVLPARSPQTQSYSGALFATADGTTGTVKDTWITHPGDLGMRLIADRIISTLNL